MPGLGSSRGPVTHDSRTLLASTPQQAKKNFWNTILTATLHHFADENVSFGESGPGGKEIWTRRPGYKKPSENTEQRIWPWPVER